MSAWRLSRAPMLAKLIKFADVIDNTGSIREHDPDYFPKYAEEKRVILTRMLEVEGSDLTKHALFNRAWKACTP